MEISCGSLAAEFVSKPGVGSCVTGFNKLSHVCLLANTEDLAENLHDENKSGFEKKKEKKP